MSVKRETFQCRFEPIRAKSTVETTFLPDDYTSGKRKQEFFSDPVLAKRRADEIAAALAAGERELLGFAGQKREIANALESIGPLGLRLDEAARLLADALNIVTVDQLLDACKSWRDSRPN